MQLTTVRRRPGRTGHRPWSMLDRSELPCPELLSRLGEALVHVQGQFQCGRAPRDTAFRGSAAYASRMSMIAAAQWTAVATIALAVFAVVTAVFAFLAYRKQSKELRSIEAHMTDLRDWAGQETELLQVQFGQLDVLRQQFEEQRAVDARHTEVLELQAQELKASLEQHEEEAVQRQRNQDAQTLAVPEKPG